MAYRETAIVQDTLSVLGMRCTGLFESYFLLCPDPLTNSKHVSSGVVLPRAMPQEVPAVDPTEPGAAVKKRPSTTHAKKVEASLAKNHVPENYFVVPALFKENENN